MKHAELIVAFAFACFTVAYVLVAMELSSLSSRVRALEETQRVYALHEAQPAPLPFECVRSRVEGAK